MNRIQLSIGLLLFSLVLMIASFAGSVDSQETSNTFGIASVSYDYDSCVVNIEGTSQVDSSIHLVISRNSDGASIATKDVISKDGKISTAISVNPLEKGVYNVLASVNSTLLYDVASFVVNEYITLGEPKYDVSKGKLELSGYSTSEAVEFTITGSGTKERGFLPVEERRYGGQISLSLKNGTYDVVVYQNDDSKVQCSKRFIVSDVELIPDVKSLTMYAGSSAVVTFVMKGCTPNDVVVSSTSECIKVSNMDVNGKITISALEIGSGKVIVRCEGVIVEIQISILQKPAEKKEYTIFIQMKYDADIAAKKSPGWTADDLEAGFEDTVTATNAQEALELICQKNKIPYAFYSGGDIKGWIDSMFGVGDVNLGNGLWKYWVQYHNGSYNQWTLGHYTDGGHFEIIYDITSESGGSAEDPNKGTNVKDNPDGSQTVSKSESGTEEDGTKFVRNEHVTTNPDGSQTITKTETRDNPDGSQTVTKEDTVKNPDGSISGSSKIETVSKTETNKDGTKTETITEKRTDSSGSSSEKESTVTTNKDGTKTETTKETSTSSDGTSVVKESTATVSKDGKVQETGTETSKDASGKVTGTTEYTKESATESDGTKKETTDETFKDVSGEVTGSKQTTVEEKKTAGGSKTTTTEVSKDVSGEVTGSKETVSEEKKTSGGSSTSTVETVRDANGDKTSVKKTETVIKNSILAGGKTGMTTTFTETTKDGSGKTTGSVESVEDVVKGGGTISVKHSETAKDASGSIVSKYEYTSERTEKKDGEITEISATKVAGDVKEKSETTILNMKDGTYSKDVSTTTTSPEGTKQKDVSTSSSKLEDGTKTTESVTEKVKDPSGKEVSSSERSSEVVDTSVEKSEKVTEKTSAGGSVSESVKASIDAKDGSSSTEAEVSMKDGSVVKAESTTTVAAEGTVGTDVIGSAVKQSEAAVGMVSSEGTDVKKTLEIEGDGATLSPEALGMIADHGASLRIGGTGGSGTMTFDDDVCENLSDQKGDVGFSMEEGDTGDLNEKQKDVVGDRFFLVLGATVGDGRIHELGGTARIAFGYAPSEGQDPAKLSVYYVDADGNRTRMDSSFDPATGMFSMTTTHFSVFMVAAEEEPVSEPSSDGDGSALLIGAAVAAIVAIAIAAVYLIRTRKV